ncbi:MAG TPA: HD domain-containing phosphohydrolase [Longimicrobiaceae bacterium]|nr:HD domain-containing phosphohydrolase [Longimicrobiaceae bacterium]
MAKARRSEAPPFGNGSVPDDPVLRELADVEARYLERLSGWEQERAELERTRNRLTELRTENERLTESIGTVEARLREEREAAERHQRRAEQLAECLKEIHRALFEGDVYELILRTCLSITGATRGVYVTWRRERETPRVRAAVGVSGYPESPPSEFLRALCRKVLDENRTLVCNQEGDLGDLPEPERDTERFRNCVVAPVVLLRNFDGIVIAADKRDGEFDDEDIEAVLAVGDQAAVAVQNLHLERQLQHAYISTVTMLADAVEAKDPYTHGHCEMASRYARLVAERLGLSDYDRSVVCYAALLHDVGKIGVSDGVLNKPGPLLPEERELMRAHVRVGYELLNHVPALHSIADVVLHHHEWYDGSGYPDGLKGDEIPMAARIVAAVDAYCAMVTRRSYKEAYSVEHAQAELKRCAGSQFDPRVVETLLAVLTDPNSEDQDEDWDAECGVLPGFTHVKELQETL